MNIGDCRAYEDEISKFIKFASDHVPKDLANLIANYVGGRHWEALEALIDTYDHLYWSDMWRQSCVQYLSNPRVCYWVDASIYLERSIGPRYKWTIRRENTLTQADLDHLEWIMSIYQPLYEMEYMYLLVFAII